MRIFASDKVGALMKKLGMQRGEAIEHPWVTRAIENAQRKVEGHNFDIRKQLLEYDDVANDQRKVIYAQRNEMMASDDLSEVVRNIREDVVNDIISEYIPHGSLDEQWDLAGLREAMNNELGIDMPVKQWLDQDADLNEDGLRSKIMDTLIADYDAKEQMVGAEGMRQYEKYILLQVLDKLWKEHLAAMDYLRQSIGLRGYAQKNPKQEYKRESFAMFTELLDRIKHDVIGVVSKVQVRAQSDVDAVEEQRRSTAPRQYRHAEASAMAGGEQGEAAGGEPQRQAPVTRQGRKIGRNEPCPCGSGKKYKHCHGKLS
jgi:preprotein translocase subunit SecA